MDVPDALERSAIVAMPFFLQFLDLANGDARHLHKVVRVMEELLRMGSPTAMVRSWKRFRAINEFSREAFLYAQKTRFDMAVVVNEILDAELNPVLCAEDEPEIVRHRSAGDGGEQLRVAAKLNGIMRFGRAGQLRVPHLISSGFIE